MGADSLYSAVAPLPRRFNLADYFLDHNLEEGRGAKVALRAGGRTQTFSELIERSRRLTAALRRLGLRPEERVLIVLPDGFEFAETWFAVLRAGGVFAMVNPLQKRAQFEEYLAYTKARIAITDSATLSELGPAFEGARLAETLLVVGEETGGFASYEQALGAERAGDSLADTEPTGPDDLAGWLFTSGSTGTPKACVHTHGDFAYSTETYALRVVGYREDDLCLSVPKLFFGYATGTNLMFPFRVGAGAVLFPERSTPELLLDLIATHRPTLLTNVPTMINGMLRCERFDSSDLSSLRVCLSAGEALPPKLYEEWKERTGVEILDGIGSAEMFHIYISNAPGDVKPGSLGRIVPGYEAEVVGPEGKPVPPLEPGRLRVRGGSTALCYWANQSSSRETFQGEWCTSADIFRRDAQGYYFYEGRADDLLKVSGVWVSPLEIENHLLAHSSVSAVCVLGREDAGLVKPIAFVVPSEGIRGSDELAAELKSFLKERLAPYKYPRWFVWRESLPLNDRGKVNRRALQAELGAAT